MTAIALDWSRAKPAAPFFTRRVRALLRLVRISGRRATLARHLAFDDARVQADLGIRRDRHRDDWLTAFLRR